MIRHRDASLHEIMSVRSATGNGETRFQRYANRQHGALSGINPEPRGDCQDVYRKRDRNMQRR